MCKPCLRTRVHHVSGLDTLEGEGQKRAPVDGMHEGTGRRSLPLDEIRPTRWTAQFTRELLRVAGRDGGAVSGIGRTAAGSGGGRVFWSGGVAGALGVGAGSTEGATCDRARCGVCADEPLAASPVADNSLPRCSSCLT